MSNKQNKAQPIEACITNYRRQGKNEETLKIIRAGLTQGITKEVMDQLVANNKSDELLSVAIYAKLHDAGDDNAKNMESIIEFLNKLNDKFDETAKTIDKVVADIDEIKKAEEQRAKDDKERGALIEAETKKMSELDERISKVKESMEQRKKEREVKKDVASEPSSAPVKENSMNKYKVYYQIPIEGVSGIESMMVERQSKPKPKISIFKKLFYKREVNSSLVGRIIDKKLDATQIEQIKFGISKGLSDDQLLEIINSEMDAASMQKLIEVYIMENAK